MPTWEHKRVPCQTISLSEVFKEPDGPIKLDAEITDWPRHTLEPNGDLARVFYWDEKRCWTLRSKRLTMLSQEGWELVAVSPPHDQTSKFSEYDVYFKRQVSG